MMTRPKADMLFGRFFYALFQILIGLLLILFFNTMENT